MLFHNKKLYLWIFILLTTSHHTFGTHKDQGYYIMAGAGISHPSSIKTKEHTNTKQFTFTQSCTYDFHLGYRLTNFLRADTNTQYRTIQFTVNDEKYPKVKNYTLMLNVYLDLNNHTELTPYVTGGTGISYTKSNDSNTKTKIQRYHYHNPAINFGGGIQYQIKHNVYLDFGYRYTYVGRIKMRTTFSKNLTTPIKTHKKIGVHELLTNIMVCQ